MTPPNSQPTAWQTYGDNKTMTTPAKKYSGTHYPVNLLLFCFYTCWFVHLRVKTRCNISVTEFWSYLIDFRCFFFILFISRKQDCFCQTVPKKRAFSQTLGDKLTGGPLVEEHNLHCFTATQYKELPAHD